MRRWFCVLYFFAFTWPTGFCNDDFFSDAQGKIIHVNVVILNQQDRGRKAEGAAAAAPEAARSAASADRRAAAADLAECARTGHSDRDDAACRRGTAGSGGSAAGSCCAAAAGSAAAGPRHAQGQPGQLGDDERLSVARPA